MEQPLKEHAVLFDLDGVLVESEHLKAAGHAASVRALGGQVDEAIYGNLMGRPHADVRSAFMRAGGISTDPAYYSQTYRAIYNRLLDEHLTLAPGALPLLERLKAAGYPLALVTSSSGVSVQIILEKFQLSRFFSVQVVVEDVQRGKPDPASYRLALEKLGLPPRQAVAVEDSSTGLQSAVGAGLRVIAVRHRFNGAQDFSPAFALVDSLEYTGTVITLIEAALRSPIK